MERLKCLDWFQKGVLLILAAMTLLFAVLYPVVIGRVGYEYRDAVLIPAQSGGSTVYSGKLGGDSGQLYRHRRFRGIPLRRQGLRAIHRSS